MLTVATAGVGALKGLLTNKSGVHAQLQARLAAENRTIIDVPEAKVAVGHYTLDAADRAIGGKYPQMYVYCERMENSLVQKFQRFSGTLDLIIELRHSSDRLETLEEESQYYLEALLSVLENSRGEWGDGYYFGGKYEVRFEPAKPGGRHFVQTLKVKVSVQVHIA